MVLYTQITGKELATRALPLTITYGFHNTPFGECQIGLSDDKVCQISFTNNTNPEINLLLATWQNANFIINQDVTEKVVKNIFSGNTKNVEILCVGTDFQHEVWKALLKIPAGKTICYEEVAKMIGKPKAVRAVASAIARNNIAYVIPCHRVISKSGQLNNYRWGADIKQKILFYENNTITKTFKLYS